MFNVLTTVYHISAQEQNVPNAFFLSLHMQPPIIFAHPLGADRSSAVHFPLLFLHHTIECDNEGSKEKEDILVADSRLSLFWMVYCSCHSFMLAFLFSSRALVLLE